MAIVTVLASLAVALCLIMTAAWAIALRTGQSGWIDSIWSLAAGIVGAVAAILPIDVAGPASSLPARQWLVAALCAFWGLRLGLHIAARNLKGGDDPRYAALRAEWGAHYARQLFLFLQIQAAAAFVLVLAAFLAGHAPGAPGVADLVGALVLIGSIVGEGIADRQLSAFRKDPAMKDRICDRGLWSWSRHPNYFFEWLGWCAYVIIAAPSIGTFWPAIFTLLAPIMMYWLLVHASGIPPLEAHMRRSRGAAFDAYAARVSAFWPLPPKR